MKISGSFKTQDNNTIRVVFYNKKNTAASININTSNDIYFGDEPVIITTEIDDTFAHLLKTQAKITLVTRRWLGDYLFADNTKSIVVNIWKNDVCIFAGYVSANTYNQQYSHELEELEINCIDTLSTLKNRRLTDDTTYEDLVAQSTIRPFSWFFDKINLEDPAGVIPNLPEFPSEEMHAWFETGWGREVNDDSSINYYGIESECVILDEDTAVATGDTRRGEDKTPTYIQSTDTCIVDGVQYYKKYAWITVNGELVNTGDWIVGDPTGDMPYVIRQETRLTGWSTGVLPQPFDFWEHMTTFDVYSNGMEIAVSDSIGEQIPETPQTTTNGSYYEFRQGADDDLDYDENTQTYYYKNYAWVCVNNVCENSGQWERGNEKAHQTGTHTAITGWQYDDPAVAFEYYETVSHYIDYSDGTSELDYTTMGHQIPLTPNTTSAGSYYEFRQAGDDDLDIDPVTGFSYYKNYAWVIVNNVAEKTNNWVRGGEYNDYSDVDQYNIYGKTIYNNSAAPRMMINGTLYTADIFDIQTKIFAFTNVPTTFTSMTLEDSELYDQLFFNNIDTSNVVDMHDMFHLAGNLRTLDISCFDFSSAGSMAYMFFSCGSLTSLDVSNWDVSSVSTMAYMFDGCSSLTSLDVSNWDVSHVTGMSYMFNGCSSLTSIDVSNWDVSHVTGMGHMFAGCSSLTSIDISGWTTSTSTSTDHMFSGCSSLTSIDVSNVSMQNCRSMVGMFSGCSSLTSIDVSSLDMPNVTEMNTVFYGCSSLTSIDVSNWDVSHVTDMDGMFSNCTSLTSIDVSGWTTSSLKDMYQMFAGCTSLTSLDLSNFDTSHVTSMTSCFAVCSSLTTLNLSNFDLSLVPLSSTNAGMWWVFQYSDNLSKLIINNVSNDTYSKIISSGAYLPTTTVIYRDNYVYKYNSNTSQWEIVNKIYGTAISTQTTAPTISLNGTTYTADVWDDTTKEFGFTNVPTNVTSISITDLYDELIFSNYIDTSNMTSMYRMFYNCSNLTSLDISHFNTSNVTNMNYMFNACKGFTSLDLSNFITDNVRQMLSLFSGCTILTSLDLSNWEVGSNTTISNMFYRTTALTSIIMNNVSDDTFNKIGSISSIHVSRITIYRDGDAYKWNSSTSQWEIQS